MSSTSSTSPSQTTSPQPAVNSWAINLLYDGNCPLCLREVNFLRKKDNGRGLVKFTDITNDSYSPEANGGVDFATAMGRIHAVMEDGTVVRNVEVFRRVYGILGMGWIYAPTGWPVVGPFVDWLYGVWADWRLALTGRPSLNTLLVKREQRQVAECNDRCRV